MYVFMQIMTQCLFFVLAMVVKLFPLLFKIHMSSFEHDEKNLSTCSVRKIGHVQNTTLPLRAKSVQCNLQTLEVKHDGSCFHFRELLLSFSLLYRTTACSKKSIE